MIKYEAALEAEKAIKIPSNKFFQLVDEGKIQILYKNKITQWWLNIDENNPNNYDIRFRHTKRFVDEVESEDKYEHTIKYRLEGGASFEVTTKLNKKAYEFLKKINPAKHRDSKVRYIVSIPEWNIGEYYIVSADFHNNDPLVKIEFELTREAVHEWHDEFYLPEIFAKERVDDGE